MEECVWQELSGARTLDWPRVMLLHMHVSVKQSLCIQPLLGSPRPAARRLSIGAPSARRKHPTNAQGRFSLVRMPWSQRRNCTVMTSDCDNNYTRLFFKRHSTLDKHRPLTPLNAPNTSTKRSASTIVPTYFCASNTTFCTFILSNRSYPSTASESGIILSAMKPSLL